MEEKTDSKLKLARCLDWLQNQNDPKKLSSQNQNDIQFIIETNAHTKKFLQSAVDNATVPGGIDEPAIEPKAVPVNRLREENLQMQCEWQTCKIYYSNYDDFQKHVVSHTKDLHTTNTNGGIEFACLWDVCGHKTSDYEEMVRHLNYHSYHAKLLAIGFNGRATLKLESCKKDSSKRNQLPPLKTKHSCMWVGCTETYNSFQAFLNHVKQHVNCTDDEFLCSWAGCGSLFSRRSFLTVHVRSHTHEKLIACFHCGHHFSCNRKLSNHLLRQNVDPNNGYDCSICGMVCASEYLMREHERQHVSAYACTLCDMSAPTPAALAHHARYRHLGEHTRTHACAHCPYRAVTKWDLRKHMPTHSLKIKKRKRTDTSDSGSSDETTKVKKEKVKKKYACHLCPEKEVKIFSRGTRLTTHLVKIHGAQWPFGHSRFRYQLSKDGMYRLTTTRFEFEDVSKKIVDGYSWPKESLTNEFEFNLKKTANATETSPQKIEITLKNADNNTIINENDVKIKKEPEYNAVEILMCDVDVDGNIISTETIKSDIMYE